MKTITNSEWFDSLFQQTIGNYDIIHAGEVDATTVTATTITVTNLTVTNLTLVNHFTPISKMNYLLTFLNVSNNTFTRVEWDATEREVGTQLNYGSGIWTNNTGRTLVVLFTWQINWSVSTTPPSKLETFMTSWAGGGFVMDERLRYGFRRDFNDMSNRSQPSSAIIIMPNGYNATVLVYHNVGGVEQITGGLGHGPEEQDCSRAQYTVINYW